MVRLVFAAGVFLAPVLFAVADASGATVFELNNSYQDASGAYTLGHDGGTFNGAGTGYVFGANQGLTLSNALLNGGSYTITVVFDFDTVSGYRKILDFKDRSSDTGLYFLNGQLNFFNFAGGGPTVAADQTVTVELSRDATTQQVTGKVNGTSALSFTDTSGAGIFSSPNQVIRFFEDDFATGGGEASSGFVDRITIEGTIPKPAVVVVPLPTAAWGGLALLGVAGATRLRRKRGELARV